jgi:plasmid stability protein
MHIRYRCDVINECKECVMIAQMTLRQVPDKVGKGLRVRARKDGRSLNRAAIELLEQALGLRATDARKRDLSRFAGQWSREDCRAFQRNTKVFEKIDPEVWSK